MKEIQIQIDRRYLDEMKAEGAVCAFYHPNPAGGLSFRGMQSKPTYAEKEQVLFALRALYRSAGYVDFDDV